MAIKVIRTIVLFGMAVIYLSRLVVADNAFDLDSDINTEMMRATYKIEGKGSAGTVVGTVFFVGIPIKDDSKNVLPVLVTATHVLNDITDDKAVLYLRKKVGEVYEKVPFELTIRKNGNNLWVRHKDADVSVMRVPVPELPIGIDKPSLQPFTSLADDGYLKDVGLHPGDELLCLGYPLGQEANESGFPILRGGKISSFPIIPMKITRGILLDFEVFRGNSGGPVYFYHSGRIYREGIHTNQFVVGLVSGLRFAPVESVTPDEYKVENKPLNIGVVVPSIFIKETVELLLSKD